MTNDFDLQNLFQEPRIMLHRWLSSEQANHETLQELCFYLQIEEDIFSSHTKQARSRELIRYCERLQRFGHLYRLANTLFPGMLPPEPLDKSWQNALSGE